MSGKISDTIDALFGTADDDSNVEDNTNTQTAAENNDGQAPTQGDAAPAATQQDDGTAALEGGKLPSRDTNATGTPAKQGSVPNTGKQQPGNKQPAAATQAQTQPGAAPARNPGDLVGRDGNVIARAGAERRFYETAQRAAQEVSRLTTENTRIDAELRAYKEAAVLPQQLNLDPNDVTTAMQFMSHWKRDPAGAAQNMLASLQAMGHNIQELGGNTNMLAIKQMIEGAVKPFQQEREQQTQEAQRMAAADAEINAVIAEHPWISSNIGAVTKLMDADKNMPLREVALRLDAWCARNGIDVNGDIEAQIAARSQQQAQAPQQPAQPQRPNPAMQPAPSVTGAPQRAASANNRMNGVASTRSKDILREVFAEHGIPIS